MDNSFESHFRTMQNETRNVAQAHGFEDYRSNELFVPTKLALIGSEVSEALEAHRKGLSAEEFGYELADIVIRTMDLAGALKIDLAAYIVAKNEINKSRAFRHGNKKY